MCLKYSLAALLATIALMGCVGPHTTITNLKQIILDPKPDGCDIKIIMSDGDLKDYEEIAIFNTVSGNIVVENEISDMLRHVKNKACSIGADAIYIKNIESGQYVGENFMAGKILAVALKKNTKNLR